MKPDLLSIGTTAYNLKRENKYKFMNRVDITNKNWRVSKL
jgi:hypothetical protein